MNFKAISLGVIGTVVANLVIGFVIGTYVASTGQDILRFMADHQELVYISNIVAGLVGGWVTYRLCKRKLGLNLLVMSSLVLFLSLLTNSSAMMGSSADWGALLLLLATGWAAPFILLVFADPNAL